MESQLTEMIRLHKVAAREKKLQPASRCDCSSKSDAAQVAALPYCEKKHADSSITTTYSEIRALVRKLEAQSVGDLRRGYRLRELRTFLNPEVPSHRGHRGYGPGAAQPSRSVGSEGNGVQRAETLRLTIVKGNYHAPLPEVVMPTFDYYSGTSDPSYIYASIRIKWRSTLTTIFPYVERSRLASRALPTTVFTPSRKTHSGTSTT